MSLNEPIFEVEGHEYTADELKNSEVTHSIEAANDAEAAANRDREIGDHKALEQKEGEQYAETKNALEELVNLKGGDGQAMGAAVDDMEKKVNGDLKGIDPNSVQGAAKFIDAEAASANANPTAYRQLLQFLANIGLTIRNLWRRIFPDRNMDSLMNANAIAQKNYANARLDYVDHKIDAKTLAERKEPADATAAALNAAIGAAPLEVKLKVEGAGGTSWGKVIFAGMIVLATDGGIAYGVWRILQALADDATGCFMYTNPTGSEIVVTKLNCPEEDHRDQCSCKVTPCTTKPTDFPHCCSGYENYPYCCGDHNSDRKPCSGSDRDKNYVFYEFVKVSPWDVLAHAAEGAGKLAVDIATAVSSVLKYIVPVLIGIGVIVLLSLLIPFLIKLFQK